MPYRVVNAGPDSESVDGSSSSGSTARASTVHERHHSVDALSLEGGRTPRVPASSAEKSIVRSSYHYPSSPLADPESSSAPSIGLSPRGPGRPVQDDDDTLSIPRTIPSLGDQMGRKSRDSLASSYSFSTWKSASSYGLDSQLYNPETSPSSATPQRQEVNQQLGDDGQLHNIEIQSLPCAGIRIPHGRLKGLFAWRFCVHTPGQVPHVGKKVMTNFVLDMACRHSPVAQEILRGLGFAGDLIPGTSLELMVQGLKLTCCVAYPGEASRLGSNFLVEAGVTLFFDSRLSAPVIYVDKEYGRKPAMENIAQTITRRFHSKVLSVISLISSGSSRSP